jgi:hypothetical protein
MFNWFKKLKKWVKWTILSGATILVLAILAATLSFRGGETKTDNVQTANPQITTLQSQVSDLRQQLQKKIDEATRLTNELKKELSEAKKAKGVVVTSTPSVPIVIPNNYWNWNWPWSGGNINAKSDAKYSLAENHATGSQRPEAEEQKIRLKDRVEDAKKNVRSAEWELECWQKSANEYGLDSTSKMWRRAQVKECKEAIAKAKGSLRKMQEELRTGNPMD